MTAGRVRVERLESLLDEPLTVSVHGLDPGQQVTIDAEAVFPDLGIGRSHAVFDADATGSVDVRTSAAVSGTYTGLDGMGLLWSMAVPAGMPTGEPQPIDVTVTASADGQRVGAVSVRRRVLGDDISRASVLDHGLVATLFAPRAGRPRPGVVVLGGSEGGLAEWHAALLASRGFTTLALAYFGLESLPANLALIPIEYVQRAIRWLIAQPTVTDDRVAIAGASKGGELALLTAATFPDMISAVVAIVPSGVAFMGIATGPRSFPCFLRSSWSQHGKPVPFVPMRFTPGVVHHSAFSRAPFAVRSIYDAALKNRARVESATFPLERIQAPVLLLSCTDDQIWPSPQLADMAYRRLLGHSHPVDHVCLEGAGHALGLPSLPPIVSVPRAYQGRDVLLGGTPAINARAATDATARALAFLQEHLLTVT